MILTDTGPLVAVCDPRDRQHALAVTHLARLAAAGLCTCEAVLVEACFHLPLRSQRERLRAVLTDFQIDAIPTGDTDFRGEVFDWLFKYGEHEPDWADGCLAVLCGRNSRLKVWTYDREFRTTWRRPNGKTIPLAVRE